MTPEPPGGGPRSLPLILARELAANLATPMFLIDAEGMLAYCNDAAEQILGRSFGEIDARTAGELGDLLKLADLDGKPVRRRDSPPGVALLERCPAHCEMLITALDGRQRRVEVTAYPLFGKADDMHGVLTVFWEARA
ncbi:MAG: PAS domain-containing protein [Acidimicrobiales bacterium]|nr:PAS domain-containing protein [Acidimicrobiales bacterium]